MLDGMIYYFNHTVVLVSVAAPSGPAKEHLFTQSVRVRHHQVEHDLNLWR